MFYFEKLKDKEILKSDLINNAQAFFTTRDICICDKGSELNAEIEDNKNLLCEYLKIDKSKFIMPEQTHSANINIVSDLQNNYPNCDALILTQKDTGIYLNFADCTPIILYDEVKNIGAIAHAGWRGTVQKIAPLTVQKMIELGSKISDITTIIGPAIGFCCYNVGEDVFEKLSKTVNNFDGLSEIREGQIFVDLKNINKRQLEEIGIEKLDVCEFCTVHNNDKFFSYRNENATTMRHSAVLKLG
ncbi:MAG: peptidoglycan editing factor PgeF [Candidatus Gastranaerophilaceae bacterium]